DAGVPVTSGRGSSTKLRREAGIARASESTRYLRRGGDAKNPDDYFDVPSKEIKELDDSVEPLEDDLILNYTTGLHAFGVTPENIDDVDTWIGRRATLDKGFRRTKIGSRTSVQDLEANGREGPYVKVSVLAPKGTRAIVPGNGSDEVILDRETAVRISNITTDAQGNKIVWAVAEPRREFTGPAAQT